MNTTPIYCFVTSNLCDNKMISWIMPPTSHWRCDDQPWSWLWSLEMIVIHFVWIHKIIINIWIWGRRRANCCWSYYVFLYDCCSAPCKWKMRAEHHYSANTTTTTTIKNDEKKHSPWIAAVPPLLLPQDDVWRVVVVLDFLHRRDDE